MPPETSEFLFESSPYFLKKLHPPIQHSQALSPRIPEIHRFPCVPYWTFALPLKPTPPAEVSCSVMAPPVTQIRKLAATRASSSSFFLSLGSDQIRLFLPPSGVCRRHQIVHAHFSKTETLSSRLAKSHSVTLPKWPSAHHFGPFLRSLWPFLRSNNQGIMNVWYSRRRPGAGACKAWVSIGWCLGGTTRCYMTSVFMAHGWLTYQGTVSTVAGVHCTVRGLRNYIKIYLL